jgi:hypothetical protein
MARRQKKEEWAEGESPKIHKIKAISSAKQDKMMSILDDLKNKIDELEEIRKGISKPIKSISPSQARAMIQEIKVPSLELIDAKPKKQSSVSY